MVHACRGDRLSPPSRTSHALADEPVGAGGDQLETMVTGKPDLPQADKPPQFCQAIVNLASHYRSQDDHRQERDIPG